MLLPCGNRKMAVQVAIQVDQGPQLVTTHHQGFGALDEMLPDCEMGIRDAPQPTNAKSVRTSPDNPLPNQPPREL